MCIYIYRICVLSEKARCTEERSLFIYLFLLLLLLFQRDPSFRMCIYIYIYLQEFV